MIDHNYLAPWQWDGRELHDANGNCVADDGSAWGEYGVKLKPNSPNGRLVAAAPELLEALQYVMSAHGEQLTDAFDQAQRAIAKATGQ